MTFKPVNPKIGAFGNKDARDKALAAFRKGDVEALTGKKPAPAAGTQNTKPETGNTIVPLLGPDGKPIKAGYLEARRLAAESGGQLPSHVLHDDVLVKLWDKLPEAEKAKLIEYYGAWARELVVHPAKDGEFVLGSDIVDSKIGWILPWSEVIKLIPASELSGKKKGLFIDPRDIVEDSGGRTIVVPASIILLHPFIQDNRVSGKVDPITRIPLEITPQTSEDVRTLHRDDTIRISLAARGYGDRRQFVDLDFRPSSRLGVGVERFASPVSGLGTALPGLSPVSRVR